MTYIIPSGFTSYLGIPTAMIPSKAVTVLSLCTFLSISTFWKCNWNSKYHHFWTRWALLEGHHWIRHGARWLKKRLIDQLSFAYGIGCPYRWDVGSLSLLVYGSQISDFDIWIQTPGDFEEFSLSCSHLGPSVKAPRRLYGSLCFVPYCSFIVNTCYQTHGIDYTNLWLFSQKYYSGIWLGEIQWFWLKKNWLGFLSNAPTYARVFPGVSCISNKIGVKHRKKTDENSNLALNKSDFSIESSLDMIIKLHFEVFFF